MALPNATPDGYRTMRDIRDVIGFYIDLCDECNPPDDVLELDACPESEGGVEAYVRPEMLHHTCAVRVTIPRATTQDDAIALLEELVQRLRDDPTYLASVWETREEDVEQTPPVEPSGHVH